MTNMKFSIVVPCYNEEKNIPLILNRFQQVMHRNDVEVILVNNGSTDESAAIFAEVLPHFSFARLVTVPINQGYGYGILQGLKAAQGEFIGWTHADMQTDPADVIKAFTLVEENHFNPKLYVKGSRRGRPLFDNMFTMGMSIFESLYLKVGIWEINAQPNVFHRAFFQSWVNPPHDFALDLYVYYLAKKSNMEIVRFAVKFPQRIHGISSWNTSFKQKLKFIKRTLDFSKKLKHSLNKSG